jgi:hypothetical protein
MVPFNPEIIRCTHVAALPGCRLFTSEHKTGNRLRVGPGSGERLGVRV